MSGALAQPGAARPAAKTRKTACRVVLDSRGRLPLTSQLVKTSREIPTLVVTTPNVSTRQLEQAGCEVLTVPAGTNGRPVVNALLEELGRRRWTNLLVIERIYFDLSAL